MKIKVLQLIPSLSTGGAERMAVDLSIGLVENGCEVLIVSLYGPDNTPLERELLSLGIDVVFLGKRRGPSIKIFFQLINILKVFKPK